MKMEIKLEGEAEELLTALMRMNGITTPKGEAPTQKKEEEHEIKTVVKRSKIGKIDWVPIIGMTLSTYSVNELNKGKSTDEVVNDVITLAKGKMDIPEKTLRTKVWNVVKNKHWEMTRGDTSKTEQVASYDEMIFRAIKDMKEQGYPEGQIKTSVSKLMTGKLGKATISQKVIEGLYKVKKVLSSDRLVFTGMLDGLTLTDYTRRKIAAGYSPEEIKTDVIARTKGKFNIPDNTLRRKISGVISTVQSNIKHGRIKPYVEPTSEGTPIAAFVEEDTGKSRE